MTALQLGSSRDLTHIYTDGDLLIGGCKSPGGSAGPLTAAPAVVTDLTDLVVLALTYPSPGI